MKSLDGDIPTLSTDGVIELMQTVLDKGCRFRLQVRGRSMTPFIRDGDKLTVAPLSGRRLSVGDVVAYSRRCEQLTQLVIHRIVERRDDGFITQGDGIALTSEAIPLSNILGRVVETRRRGKRVRFGFGPERRLIAWMSRARTLWRMLSRFGRKRDS